MKFCLHSLRGDVLHPFKYQHWVYLIYDLVYLWKSIDGSLFIGKILGKSASSWNKKGACIS